jgi:hypothetical protein
VVTTTVAPTTVPPVTTVQPTTAPSTTSTTTTSTTTTTTAAPTTTAPPSAPGLPVNEALIPAPTPGRDHPRIGPSNGGTKYLTGDNVGAFRVSCFRSHFNFDDAIVSPGRPRATHLHVYAGNLGVNANSTNESINTSGNSTCTGGTLNRSAYWAPAVIDTATGAPIYSTQHLDQFLQVYYKTGYMGVPTHTVQNFPPGLRMIAGNAMASGPADNPWGPVQYSCLATGARGELSGFPQCAPGDHLVMAVTFPQCWDGINLDSPNHKSHMAYGVGWGNGLNGQGCPASHPVPLPEITQNWRYQVPAGGMSTWRLSSDTYSGTPGYSGHADWWNGWNFDTFQIAVDNCYQGGWDCRLNLLGNGQELFL